MMVVTETETVMIEVETTEIEEKTDMIVMVTNLRMRNLIEMKEITEITVEVMVVIEILRTEFLKEIEKT